MSGSSAKWWSAAAAAAAATKSLQLCLTLCDPIDGSKHKFSATEVQSTFALPVKEDGFASIYFNISGL